MTSSLFITGGAGFIGGEFVRTWLAADRGPLVVLDKFTYAASREALAPVAGHSALTVVEGDIGDRQLVAALLARYRPRTILNLAAESHVDRSIAAPAPFVQTNVVGTWQLLEAALAYWRTLETGDAEAFRFIQGSTDEVYGDLPNDEIAVVGSPYAPSSPYAAAKGAADHWVRAYHRTYGLPTIVVCSTNNYGPFQIPEKLIPVVITRALTGEPIPLYGDGRQQRDWLYVADNCAGLIDVIDQSNAGETVHLASEQLTTNLELVHQVCELVDHQAATGRASHEQITHVADRPGHDRRYALDASSGRRLGWQPRVSLAEGLERTVAWFLAHREWTAKKLAILSGGPYGHGATRQL